MRQLAGAGSLPAGRMQAVKAAPHLNLLRSSSARGPACSGRRDTVCDRLTWYRGFASWRGTAGGAAPATELGAGVGVLPAAVVGCSPGRRSRSSSSSPFSAGRHDAGVSTAGDKAARRRKAGRGRNVLVRTQTANRTCDVYMGGETAGDVWEAAGPPLVQQRLRKLVLLVHRGRRVGPIQQGSSWRQGRRGPWL
jgi:hypothetical protein